MAPKYWLCLWVWEEPLFSPSLASSLRSPCQWGACPRLFRVGFWLSACSLRPSDLPLAPEAATVVCRISATYTCRCLFFFFFLIFDPVWETFGTFFSSLYSPYSPFHKEVLFSRLEIRQWEPLGGRVFSGWKLGVPPGSSPVVGLPSSLSGLRMAPSTFL